MHVLQDGYTVNVIITAMCPWLCQNQVHFGIWTRVYLIKLTFGKD